MRFFGRRPEKQPHRVRLPSNCFNERSAKGSAFAWRVQVGSALGKALLAGFRAGALTFASIPGAPPPPEVPPPFAKACHLCMAGWLVALKFSARLSTT